MKNLALSGTETARPARFDLGLTLLSVLLILVLIGAVFWILRPFLLSAVWAMMIVVATWPIMIKVQKHLRRRVFAVALMSIAMLGILVVPLLLAIQTLVSHLDTISNGVRAISTMAIPPPPDWVQGIPLIGGKISAQWASIAAAGKSDLANRMAPYLGGAAQWVAAVFGGFGIFTVQFLLTVIITVVLYMNGETTREVLIRFGRRLAGDQGEAAVILAGQAIRAVALGVVVTALVQTVLAGLGLWAAGVPFASLLTGVVLLLCIAQIGPILVLAPAVVWLFWSGATGWGSALLVWTILVGALDNVLRPMLIRQGADLPLLLIFAGVIGGLLSFGIVGLFVGPVVLAIAYTLIQQWLNQREPTPVR